MMPTIEQVASPARAIFLMMGFILEGGFINFSGVNLLWLPQLAASLNAVSFE